MPAELDTAYAHAGFGVHFAQVGVDRDTGEVRVRRMLGGRSAAYSMRKPRVRR
jgi:CO/xanthine dehydrogenase Mo-binding subunit